MLYLQPTRGHITIAGEDIRTFDKREWAKVVSLVNQVSFECPRVQCSTFLCLLSDLVLIVLVVRSNNSLLHFYFVLFNAPPFLYFMTYF